MSTENTTKKQKMNLPNRLTVLRMCLVPVFMAVMLLPIGKLMPESLAWWLPRVIAAVIFIVSSFTDMLDGKIARKHNLVTDFGKFLDPLADKTLVIGAEMYGRNGESIAVFGNHCSGAIFLYRLWNNFEGKATPASVLLHELGHQLHFCLTGELYKVP